MHSLTVGFQSGFYFKSESEERCQRLWLVEIEALSWHCLVSGSHTPRNDGGTDRRASIEAH